MSDQLFVIEEEEPGMGKLNIDLEKQLVINSEPDGSKGQGSCNVKVVPEPAPNRR